MNPKIALSALCLALAPCLHATIYFQNSGNTSGWDQLYVEHNGSVTTVNSPVYSGSTAIQAEQIYDPNYTGRYHAEARYNQGAAQGWDRYYGYALYLPSNWQFVDQNFNIMQFIGTPTCSTSGGKPWTMLWIRNNALTTRVTTGPDGCTRTDTNYTITANYVPGTWHTIVLHVDWESDSTGAFTLWYDGSAVIDLQNTATCPNDSTTMEFAIGQYANGWHDNGTMLGTQSVRDIYEDQVTIASSYAEANPAATTSFTITANAGAGGTISPSGSVSVAQGTNKTFTITANSGDVISSVTVDGVNQGAISTYTFGNVQANHTISAAFSSMTTGSNVAPNGTAYGWSANTSSTANTNRAAQPGLNDNNLTNNVDLDSAGDAIGAWEGAGVVWSSAQTISSASFINGDITTGGDGFLTANCTLQYSTDGSTWSNTGWTISPTYPNSSSAGGQTYSASGTALSGVLGMRFVGQVRTTDTSYHWIVKEVQFIGSGGSVTNYTITASAGTGGTISPSGSVSAAQGSNQTFTITANSGDVISSVTVDGVNQGAISSYTFANVQANHTISAAFSATTTAFTITASAGTGGSITPAGSVTVNQGTSQTFTVAASSGYSISSVTVDGVNQGAISSYTFSNVQANHTISAAFSATTTDSNIAPNGTAYGWNANTSSSSNSNRSAQPGLNDNNLTNNVDLNPNGDAIGAWEAAGVIWSSAKTISSADFINGTITSGGDGFLTANLFMQYTTDGATWNSSGWSITPSYPYSSSAGGQKYTASGTTLSGVLGVRFIGQVRTTDTSYHWIVKEVQFIGH